MRRPLVRAMTAVALSAAATLAIAGCSSSGSSDATSTGGGEAALTAALEKGGEITYWTWTPSAEAQVAAFEKEYPNVTVNLVNAGTGSDQYSKLQNAVTAGSGAPDVAQIEYFALPQFTLTEAVADLSGYGFGDLESEYNASTWESVSDDSGAVYGLPQDSGPMALFYNAAIFEKYDVEVPTTWAEYVEAAKKLHAADPDVYITADSGDAGFTTSMIWQAGGRPFTVDGTNVTINLQDEGTKKWTATWNELVENDLLSQTTGWTDDWYRQLGTGEIATLVTGAWMPGTLISSVADASGDWRVAPIPTYDGGTAVSANNGGSAQVVMEQSQNKDLAAAFLKWLNNSESSVDVFLESGGFPATTADLTDTEFVDSEQEYFGGQKINQVLTAAAESVGTGWQYLPFEVYANSIYADTVGQAYQNGTSLDDGLLDWQEKLITYGNAQGFTVTAGS